MSSLFSETVHRLLSGEVICPYTREDVFHYLSDEQHRETVETYLARIDRTLRQTRDQEGFLLVHKDATSHQARTESRQMFEEIAGQMRPLLAWLSFAMRSGSHGRPVRAGDVIRESDLLRAVEDSPDLTRGLNELCRLKAFQNPNKQTRYQLHRVLDNLKDMGYLVQKNSNQTVYTATGRFSVLYDVMEFIVEHAGLADVSTDDDEAEGDANAQLDLMS